MRKIAIFILLAMAMALAATAIAIILCSPAFGQTDGQAVKKILFFQAIHARMRILEQNYQVKFDPNWVAREKVIFVIPEDSGLVQRKNFGAEYHSDTQHLFF